ncbi:MAG: hypothetical protein ABI960_10800 [Candidatus Eisenbacteria bacterium]
MRSFFPVSLIALTLALAAPPAGASDSIVDRPPMDLGGSQTETIARVGQDLLDAPHSNIWWFDAGLTYPMSTLKKSNIDPGLLVRVNHQIYRRDALGVVGSVGAYFGQDSYFNDQQEAIANAAPVNVGSYSGVDIQSRYYMATPAVLALQIAPVAAGTVSPIIAFGPAVVWEHRATVTSAVNNGVGEISLGSLNDPLVIGPGGEQGISPYAIRTHTSFNLGWDARVGIGFRMTSGPQPLWMRLLAGGTTYYHHTAPRTLLTFAASFSR